MKNGNYCSDLILAAAILVTASVSACSNDCVKGSGEIGTEERSVDPFRQIASNGAIDVVLVQSSNRSVTVEADANLLSIIETKVSGTTLEISTNRCYTSERGITVTVSAPDFSSVTLNGSGSVSAQGPITAEDFALGINGSGEIAMEVVCGTLRTSVNGSGDMELSGRADDYLIEINGSGDVQAFDLQTARCSVEISGSGEARVHAEERLDAEIAGSGDVLYMGSPKVSATGTGSGEVRQR